MNTEDSNILSARITALQILQTQMLSVYLMGAKDAAGFVEELKEGRELLLTQMRPAIQEEARRYLDGIYREALRAAQQPG